MNVSFVKINDSINHLNKSLQLGPKKTTHTSFRDTTRISPESETYRLSYFSNVNTQRPRLTNGSREKVSAINLGKVTKLGNDTLNFITASSL